MTTVKEAILQGAAEVQQDLNTVLEGMDYCLDWKSSDDDWSAREILWHVLEDPEGGIPNAVEGILNGSLAELEIIADETHLSPARQEIDLDAIRGELGRYFARLSEVVGGATDQQIQERKTPCWFPRREHREDRTAQNLLEGLFLRHWREHVGQLRDIREGLGLG